MSADLILVSANKRSDFDSDIYDAFGTSSSKTNQEHLDTICALAANIAEAQTYYPVVSTIGHGSIAGNELD